MSRRSKNYNLGYDEAKLEGIAALMSANRKIPFDKAKDKLVNAYFDSARKATKGGKGIDEDKFTEQMDDFIKSEVLDK